MTWPVAEVLLYLRSDLCWLSIGFLSVLCWSYICSAYQVLDLEGNLLLTVVLGIDSCVHVCPSCSIYLIELMIPNESGRNLHFLSTRV